MRATAVVRNRFNLSPAVALELLKPVTWFPPMWAFGCGLVSAGAQSTVRWPVVFAGVVLCGPLVCGTSQAVNDWFDRHVDAVNEPARPIPSGRLPGRLGLYIAIAWTCVSLLVATVLGTTGVLATIFGLALAWAYSAPPLRLKRNGWFGNSAVALCYEGLPWVTGAAVIASSQPDWRIVLVAFLYSAGAHGIMTLNDFKSVSGDRKFGINSLPVMLGDAGAARLACVVMAVAQVAVIGLLVLWHQTLHAVAVSLVLVAQLLLMRRLLQQPRELAPWYNATGISLFVLGMLISAFALRSLTSA